MNNSPSGQRPLRVGVDFHVVDGKFQGSRTHVIELFAKVVALCPDVEFFFFLAKPELLGQLSKAFGAPNVHAARMPAENPLIRLYWQLPRQARRHALDVIHTQYILPRPVSCRRVVTIHDILFETHPEYFTPIFTARSRALIRHAAKHADRVLTVSEFSRGEICRLYGANEKRVSVIHNGVDYERFASPAVDDDAILRRHGLKAGGYILSVGRFDPRKNHKNLIRAYARLQRPAPPLVLVGQRGYRFDSRFAAVKELGLNDRVHVFENVSDKELPAFYRGAALFAYPTFAEGFGMPIVEAMAAGAPVVTSNTTAIPEVAGAAGAILVDPHDIAALASAMCRVLSDSSLSGRLSDAGRETARQFTWDAAARTVRDVYLSLP